VLCSSKVANKVYEDFLLGYDSNSRAYHVFNNDSSCVKTTCNVVFDEANGSQEEQVDLDFVDDEEAPCDILQRMPIGNVRPQDPSEQPKGQSPSDTTSPTQELDQDEYEDEDEHNDQVQEESNDQGGDEDDGDKKEATQEQHHHIQECTTPCKEITP
jgi:hypothetical protein